MQCTMKFLSSFLAATAVCCSLSAKTIYYYDAINGNDDNDGLTEKTAFQTAPATVKGNTEYRFMKGTYPCSIKLAWQTHNVTLTGWKAGRDEVILDGGGTQRCVHSYDNKVEDQGTNLVIQGLTFWRGGGTSSTGAGLYLVHPNPVISNCVFSACSNTVQNSMGAGFYVGQPSVLVDCVVSNCCAYQGGGGFMTQGAAGSVLRNCTFVNNEATNDAGAGGGGLVASAGGIVLDGCKFIGNRATANIGGGMSVSYSAANNTKPSFFTNCEFRANSSFKSGGGFAYNNTRDAGTNCFVRCVFVDNASDEAGGGIYSCMSGTRPASSCCLVEDCAFTNNSAKTCGGGAQFPPIAVRRCSFSGNRAGQAGGGFCFNSTPRDPSYVENCTFVGNVTTNAHSAANQVGGGCAVWFASNSYAFMAGIRNCLFKDNVVSNGVGGGVGLNNTYFAQAIVENCTFVGNGAAQNTSGTSGTGGGAVGAYSTKTTHQLAATNCVFWGNWAPEGCTANVQIGQRCYADRFGNCLEQDATGSRLTDGVNGNRLASDVSRVFTDYAGDNYVPVRKGFLFGTGALRDGIETEKDLAGNPRIRDDAEFAVDIGCYQLRLKRGFLLLLK